MVDELAAVCGGDALFHFLKKPFIVVDHAFDGFQHKRLAIAALFGGETSELGLQIGFQADSPVF